jgi:hypothetical protein
MPLRRIRKAGRTGRKLRHAAKISDYRFRKVLWHYVRDHSAAQAARETGVSTNSVSAIYRKLRVFFFEVGLFTDIYQGQDPCTFESEDLTFERDLITYHLERMRGMRRAKCPADEPDYHFAESHWRFHFQVLLGQRASEEVYAMMLTHLAEIIRLCGPVGQKPSNLGAGLMAVVRQMDQRILWLERNGPEFRSDERRAELKSIRGL